MTALDLAAQYLVDRGYIAVPDGDPNLLPHHFKIWKRTFFIGALLQAIDVKRHSEACVAFQVRSSGIVEWFMLAEPDSLDKLCRFINVEYVKRQLCRRG